MKNFIPFFDRILRFFFGSKQERDLKRIKPLIELIELFELAVHNRPDRWFAERTEQLKKALARGVDRREQNEYNRELLTGAHRRIDALEISATVAEFAEQLEQNRAELINKYRGDAFEGAIKSPLADKNINRLKAAYRERLEGWKALPPEKLIENYKLLWDNYIGEAPDSVEALNLWLLIPEAFAMVREVAHRRLGLRHYPVQLTGGLVLHEGRIAEMKTGEGKTLAATLPLYLNSLAGKGAHLVTVNDYLARRDARWMGEIYQMMGVSVGLIQQGMKPEERQPAYAKDITYGTNNEFGFDYLRDNMAVRPEDMVQRPHQYAIIDEVDSVLIDEARTPLIISGRAGKPVSLYTKIDRLARRLQVDRDYEIDEKKNSVSLLDPGIDRIEQELDLDNLFSTKNMELVHHVHQAIRAHKFYEVDAEYVVVDNQVVIVDQFTGRLQPGRRFSDGLHQAIEAKEGVKIKQENKTLSTITIQNFFRLYNKLAGMTGTADTEAEEFGEIYGLDVVVIPTNKPDIRVDKEDAIYRTKQEKYRAVVEKIRHLNENRQPVLVGTIDIETSELLGRLLEMEGIAHAILNAKNHEREAAIVAEAGQPGAVTIATNMAGRGTDIVLGDGVIEEDCPRQPADTSENQPFCPHKPICGLHVIGTERHESRRIDNQLRGRTARQGDPGASQFFVSLEDDLMRLFGSDKISGMLGSLGLQENQKIEHSWISRSIKRAQSKVESHNFEIRKRLLEYDDVLDRQRKIIYRERNLALHEADISGETRRFLSAQVEDWLDFYANPRRPAEDWPLSELLDATRGLLGWNPLNNGEDWKKKRFEEVRELLNERLVTHYDRRREELGAELFGRLEKQLLLQVIDTHWKEHIDAMDSLKQGIHLEGMAQKDPLVEYKRRGFEMFEQLQNRIREDFLRFLFQVKVVDEQPRIEAPEVTEYKHDPARGISGLVADDTARSQQEAVQGSESKKKTFVKKADVGRNDPCPCESGKKYKHCCGR